MTKFVINNFDTKIRSISYSSFKRVLFISILAKPVDITESWRK